MIFYVGVIVPINIDKVLTYHYEEELKPGDIVEVQVLNKNHLGIVANIDTLKPNFVTKPILHVVIKRCYSEAFVKTISWIAQYYFCPLGLVLKNFFPAHLPSRATLPNFPQNTPPIQPVEENSELQTQLRNKKIVVLSAKDRSRFYQPLIAQILAQNGVILILIPNDDYLDTISEHLKIFQKQFLIFRADDKKKRIENWWRVKECEQGLLVVGTKNVLELPFRKIDLMIIEEEQDDLYQQEKNLPHYNARNAFLFFATQLNARVILDSDCPSLASFYNVKKGKYGFVGGMDPNNNIFLSQCKTHMGDEVFTNLSLRSMKKCLEEGEKILILQNRLGYLDNVTCKQCGFFYKCDDCSSGLTFHKSEQIFRCHHCQKTYPTLDCCPDCNASDFSFTALGIEKIWEYLQTLFPEKKFLLVDAESIKRKRDKEKILKQISQVDGIIGTRAIENVCLRDVELAVLPDFDRLLTDNNFFTNERVFKLLMRWKNLATKMIVQTSIPEHRVFHFSQFYTEELHDRLQFKYPPMSRLLRVEFQAKDEKKLYKNVEKFVRALKAVKVEVVGEEKRKVFMVKKRYGMNVWVRVKNNADIVRDVLRKFDMKVFAM